MEALYVLKGVININDAEMYANTINGLEGLSATSHSDILYISSGQMYINAAKFEGSIFKSDSATIYLKSALLKYSDESNIYLDFSNDGSDKTLLTGSSYAITSDDLDNISLIDSSSGSLSFTHLSFDAVKLPGELRRLPRHLSLPISLSAVAPIPAARLSHQMIAGRRGF